MRTLIVSLILFLTVGIASSWEAEYSFDDSIAMLDRVAIEQPGGSRGKGIVDGKEKYICTIVFYSKEHKEIVWEFELLNWSRDLCVEVFKLKDGSYHVFYAKVVGYKIIDNYWINYLEYFNEFELSKDQAGEMEEGISFRFQELIDSPLSGTDANTACIKHIREKIKEGGTNEDRRFTPKGHQGPASTA